MRIRKKSFVAVLTAAVALIVAAVASLGGSATAASAPIKIMASYPVGSAYPAPENFVNVKAAIAAVNKAGGINGVKVQIIGCDNGQNPNTTAQCAAKAVSSKVVAVVGYYGFLSAQGMYPTLEKANIPSIGNSGTGSVEFSSPMSFPVSESAQAYVAGPPIAMARAGCKKIAPVGFDDPAYSPYFAFASAGIKKAGVGNVGAVRFPASTTDMTATVQTAIDRGADCIFTLGPDPTTVPLVRAIKNSGKNIHLGGLTHVTNFVPSLKTQLDGSAVVAPTPRPYVDLKSKNKYMKQYLAEMKAAGQLKAANITDNGVAAWTGTQFFISLAKSLPKGQVTSANLIKAGNKAKFSLPGFLGASDFTKAAPCPKSAPRVHNYTVFTKKVVKGKLVETGTTDLANTFKSLGC